MTDSIKIIVESMPSDSITLALNTLSGIVVPIMLLLLTRYMTRKSEERAKEYANSVRIKGEKAEFLHDFHHAISELFKSVQELRHNNLKRKTHEDYGKIFLKSNETKKESVSKDAIVMHNDLLKWQLDKLLEFEAEHGMLVIQLEVAKERLQVILSEEITEKVVSKVEVIRESSTIAGGVLEEMILDFVTELNILSKTVKDNPEPWLH